MAGDKKGFILYADLIHTVNQLPNDKAGKLFKHILSYVNDKNPQSKDMIINVAFEPIKQQLKRDLKKYEGKKLQWSDAGKASAEARKQRKKETNERSTDSTNVKDRSTDSTVNVNDTVNVTVKDNVRIKEIPTYKTFIAYALYNKQTLLEESIKFKYDAWIENDWKDGNDKNITNWKSKLLNTIPFLKEKPKETGGRKLTDFET